MKRLNSSAIVIAAFLLTGLLPSSFAAAQPTPPATGPAAAESATPEARKAWQDSISRLQVPK
jgi:hypothetical protein